MAVLSRHKIKVAAEGLPGFDDDNARYLEAVVNVNGENFRTASIYLPNGNPPYNDPDDTSKFTYKLRWMEALYNRTAELLHSAEPVVLGGDFNVILTNHDVYNPELFRKNALFRPEVIQRLKAIKTIWDCASITSGCHRKRPTACSLAKWIKRPAPEASLPTIRL